MKFNDSSVEDTAGAAQNLPASSRPKRTVPVGKIFSYVIVVGLGAGGVLASQQWFNTATRSPQTAQSPELSPPVAVSPIPAPSPVPNAAAPIANNFIAEAVAKVGSAVVRIDAQRTVSTDLLRDPFGRMFEDEAPFQPPSRIEEGTGSGFIIDRNGLILTNTHVVDGAEQVTVVLKDGRQFAGEVLGQDPATDVAVVKIEASDLPTVTIGDSDQLQPGEWAIAIGNPLGLDNTVTAGIISATGRSSAEIGVADRRVGFIQTDAAINPGNSGGPLLNQQGEVIGMNTAIINGAQGLGFAVPINTAQRIANQLITNGQVEHPYLGIRMITLTPEIKDQLNTDPSSGFTIQDEQGILIVEVMSGSPAERAGLQQGDVILTMDGKQVDNAEAVQQVVEAKRVGESIAMRVRRAGETLERSVTIGVLPDPST